MSQNHRPGSAKPVPQTFSSNDLIGTPVKNFLSGHGWLHGKVVSWSSSDSGENGNSERNIIDNLYHVSYDNDKTGCYPYYAIHELFSLTMIQVGSRLVLYSYLIDQYFKASVKAIDDTQINNIHAEFENKRADWIDIRRFKFHVLAPRIPLPPALLIDTKLELHQEHEDIPSQSLQMVDKESQTDSAEGQTGSQLNSTMKCQETQTTVQETNDQQTQTDIVVEEIKQESQNDHVYQSQTLAEGNRDENSQTELIADESTRAENESDLFTAGEAETKTVAAVVLGRKEMASRASFDSTDTWNQKVDLIAQQSSIALDIDSGVSVDDAEGTELLPPSESGSSSKRASGGNGRVLKTPPLSAVRKGTKLAILWEPNQEYYSVTVVNIRKAKNRISHFIQYDQDSYREWTSLANREFYLLEDFLRHESFLKSMRVGCLSSENIKKKRREEEESRKHGNDKTSDPYIRIERPDDVNRMADLLTARQKTLNSVSVGCRVAIWWANEKTYFKGTITEIRDNKGAKQYHIKYDDGDKAWVTLEAQSFFILFPFDQDNHDEVSTTKPSVARSLDPEPEEEQVSDAEQVTLNVTSSGKKKFSATKKTPETTHAGKKRKK